ncbi:diguanylate cyclase, partial [Devosia sp. 66-14]
MWPTLVANFAVVGLAVSGWLQLQPMLTSVRRQNRRLLFGLVMSLGAVASMMMSVQLSPGIYFDLRSTFLALSSLIGGPVAAALTAVTVLTVRVAMGGAGVWSGATSVVLVVAVGLLGHAVLGKRTPGWVATSIFSIVSSAAPMAGVLLLPTDAREQAFATLVGPVVGLSTVATFVALSSIARTRKLVEERKLIRAALRQAPDYLYVKDTFGRFVEVNAAVAEVNGFASPDDVKGLTDADLSPERAPALMAQEQRILANGQGVTNLEEQVPDLNGTIRWYLTSKTPVYNIDGEVLGLAGTTRDITDRKRLEAELAESRTQLSTVLTEMSDGIALFDRNGVLRFCNEQYRDYFPLTGNLRSPGAPLESILRASVTLGEQLDVPPDKVDDWVKAVLESLDAGAEEEARLFDGRWLHIRTSPIRDGGATVRVADITKLKRAEAGLLALTEQLRILADTDGLTGLVNRRRLDEDLDRELKRAARDRQSLSLIMLDIDRFKAFNDRYGHPAGDKCIKAVAGVLAQKARRPGDIAARYGGEEMCVVLPNTDEAGAYAVAEIIRSSVRDLRIGHEGSEKAVVTVSLGVSTCARGDETRIASVLVSRADEALYLAKSAGRDR